MSITKENYKTLVWDESISKDDYFDFYKTLSLEEVVTFLKFLLKNYPNYDEHWIESYFEINDQWSSDGDWEKINDFSDFVRAQSPEIYKNEFQYLDGC